MNAEPLPVAQASAAAPAGGRRMWACFARCPHCHGSHLHRAHTREALEGAVRAGCGKPYRISVKRVYTPRDEAA